MSKNQESFPLDVLTNFFFANKLVHAGYVAFPRGSRQNIFVSATYANNFSFGLNRERVVDRLHYNRGQFMSGHDVNGPVLLEEGRTEGDTRHVLAVDPELLQAVQDGKELKLKEKDCILAIHPDFLPFFGKQDVFVFDWGTLSNNLDVEYRANMLLSDWYGKSIIGYEDWLANPGSSAYDFLRRNVVSAKEDDVLLLYHEFYRDSINRGILPTVNEDSDLVLRTLKKAGKQVVVVGREPRTEIARFAQEYGIADYIDEWDGDLRYGLSNFLDLIERNGGRPHDIVYVGGDAEGLAIARTVGMHTAAVTYGRQTRDVLEHAGAEFLFDSLNLVPLLRPMAGGGIGLLASYEGPEPDVQSCTRIDRENRTGPNLRAAAVLAGRILE